MTQPDENPRAVVGDNRAPDYAARVVEQMRRDYAELDKSVTAQLDEARVLPTEIEDDAGMGLFAGLIKRLRDTAARIEAFRVAEKEPHYRSGQAVDQFFFVLADKVARRDKKAKPGAADILQARLDAYQQRKLAEEQARRRAEAETAERLAREAREKADREAREAEEARATAERARAPAQIEAKDAVATAREADAIVTAIDAQIAVDRAEEAHIATLAKPADMVRTRTDGGALVTMGTEPYAEVEDYDKLDKAKLWPFIHREAIDKAVRAWAKTTGHVTPMDGAKIGKRAKSVVR